MVDLDLGKNESNIDSTLTILRSVMRKDIIKKEFTGLVLTMFVGLFGTGAMADYKSESNPQGTDKKVEQNIDDKKK